MTSLGQLGLEIVVDAASKLENNGVSIIASSTLAAKTSKGTQ